MKYFPKAILFGSILTVHKTDSIPSVQLCGRNYTVKVLSRRLVKKS